jgi:signal transduction histidine kinase
VKRDGRRFAVEFGVSKIALAGMRYFVVSLRAFSQGRGARCNALVANMGALVANIGRLALEAPDQNASFQKISELVAAELEIDAVAIIFRHRSSGAIQMPAAVGLTPPLSELAPKLWLLEFSTASGTGNAGLSLTFSSLCDAPTTPLRKQLVDAGYADLIAMPMFDRGQVIGGLFAFTYETYSFDRDKVVFLQSVVNLLTAAVQRSRAEEQLANARRLDAVGQLTGGVAHDFNNLLTVISGNLQLLQVELRDKPRTASILAGALRAVGRGSDLTRKLLAFGRRQRLNPQTLKPFRQITELKPALAATLGKTMNILVESTANLPNVFVDPAEFEATLINLALNARDAMPEGGTLQIDIRARRVGATDGFIELRPGQYVLISVRDGGPGMTPEVLAHALEPFFTTKEVGLGNGLGLSMVYGFVKQSGGHLVINSNPGCGTCLDIYLPGSESHDCRASAHRGDRSVRRQRNHCRGRRRSRGAQDRGHVSAVARLFDLRSRRCPESAALAAQQSRHIAAVHRRDPRAWDERWRTLRRGEAPAAESARAAYVGL